MRDIAADIVRIFKSVGMPATVKRTDGTVLETHALIQPLLYKNKLYVELQPSEYGKFDDGCYLFLGPANCEFTADDIVIIGGEKYITQRYEMMYLFSRKLYGWAILRPCVERISEV